MKSPMVSEICLKARGRLKKREATGDMNGGREKSGGRGKKIKGPDGGAAPSALGCDTPLPPAYWGEQSGLACLDTVVSDVWAEGYSHHITRLMILSNLATLLDVRPEGAHRLVLGCLYRRLRLARGAQCPGDGDVRLAGLMTTKPYVSGAAYINSMTDYCSLSVFQSKMLQVSSYGPQQ